MKVVLFCGGFGMRMRESSETIPKPMVRIGCRPILWHIMKYYAHYGHKDFILCLGWNAIKEYFLTYDECVSNDFVLSGGGDKIKLLGSDIHDWNITFVDTGTQTVIGQRLKAVERHLEGEEVFLANYADGLSDVHLPSLIGNLTKHDSIGTFVSVRPSHTFHAIDSDADGKVHGISPIETSDVWMNGGFFVFRNDVFRYIHDGDDLVDAPFNRLIAEGRLSTYRHHGFWSCMDTYKERRRFDDMYSRGNTPWELWKHPSQRGAIISSEIGGQLSREIDTLR